MSVGALQTIENFLQQGSVRRRAFLVLLLGAFAGLAFAPFSFFPAFLVSFPALFVVMQSAQRARDSFLFGWCFAFAHLVVNLHWMAGALFVDIASFWWALPFAVAGLPALLALYYGLAGMIFWRVEKVWPVGRVFLLALLWTLADLARAHLFTGLPWDIAGYVWGNHLPVLQSASLIGVEGLTLVTLLVSFAPALAFDKGAGKPERLFAVLLVLLFTGFAGWGAWRIFTAPESFVENVRMRLVQPDQDQAMKWRADQRAMNFHRLLQATFGTPADKRVTHYIWPETATSFYLTEEPLVRSEIAGHMAKDSYLLTGVVRRTKNPQDDQSISYYNSLVALDSRGNVIAGYDKHHLVPFGEYMPLRGLLPFRMISAFGSDFMAGPQALTIHVPDLPPVGPSICYEAIFSGEVAEHTEKPAFLLNVTNDGWYDGTIGPAQHFAMVRARAVEEGTPLVRVANKGTTAVVDPWGRITAEYKGRGAGFVDADLPSAMRTETVLKKQQVRPVWLINMILFSLLGCRNWLARQRKSDKKER